MFFGFLFKALSKDSDRTDTLRSRFRATFTIVIVITTIQSSSIGGRTVDSVSVSRFSFSFQFTFSFVDSGFTDSAIRSPSAISVGWIYRRGSVSRSAVGFEFFFVGLGSVSTLVLNPSVILGSMVVGGVCWICHRASQLGSVRTVVITIAVVGLTRSES